MTTKEYLNLKALLVQGCIPERIELISSMDSRQLCDFAERLDFGHGEPLQLETWRWIARVLSIRYSQDLDLIHGPVFNGKTETASARSAEAVPVSLSTFQTSSNIQKGTNLVYDHD